MNYQHSEENAQTEVRTSLADTRQRNAYGKLHQISFSPVGTRNAYANYTFTRTSVSSDQCRILCLRIRDVTDQPNAKYAPRHERKAMTSIHIRHTVYCVPTKHNLR